MNILIFCWVGFFATFNHCAVGQGFNDAVWLNRIGTYEAKITLAELYMATNQPNKAIATHNAMTGLSPRQLQELMGIRNIWGIRNAMQHAGLTPGHRKQLENMAAENMSYASALARNLLSEFDTSYAPLLALPTVGAVYREPGMDAEKTAKRGKGDIFTAYPNPTNRAIWFDLGVPCQAGAKILVFSALGKRIAVLNVPVGSHNIQWQTAQIPDGAYHAQISCEGRTPRQVSFIVNH